MDRKKILLIIGFSLLSIAIGFGIYWFFFRSIFAPTPPTAPQPAVTPSAQLPTALPAAPRVTVPTPAAPAAPAADETAAGGLTKTVNLTTAPSLSPNLSPDGSSLSFYNRADGKFYRLTPDGQLEPLSDKVFYNVQNITWAPNRDKAILEYPDQSKILYNFASQTQVSLPKHWQEFSFSPSSEQISFLSMGLDKDNRWLAISNADGSKTEAIEALGDNAKKVQVAWAPNNQVLAFSKTGEAKGLDSQEILLVGKKHENFKSIIVNGINFNAKWAPDGEKILYSVTNGNDDWKPSLWVVKANVDTIGQNKTPLNLQTWAEKCTFSDASTLYCAVPKELPRGAGLVQKIADTIADDLYKVDLNSGATSLVAIPSEDHTINNIIVTDDAKYLYFTDKANGQVFKINLK